MSCDVLHRHLSEYLEDPAGVDEGVRRHVEKCAECRAELEAFQAVRARLVASSRAAGQPALEERVMRRVAAAVPVAERRARGLPRRLYWAPVRRAVLGTAGAAIAALVIALAFLREPTPAWSIEQSIEALSPYRALHMRGTIGGAPFELWARTSPDHVHAERLLIRIPGQTTIWIDGNATHYYVPRERIVYTDDARTAGFNPWPGSRHMELAQAAGVRVVEYRRRFPIGRSVVVEWSMLSDRGPTSARAEFDVDSKLLRALTQWDNLDRSGAPGFETHDIEFARDLPERAFSPEVPADARYQPRPLQVSEAVLGVLALPDAGLPAPGLSLGEAGRLVVTRMLEAVIANDLAEFRRLCPVARAWDDPLLTAILGDSLDPQAATEVVEVEPGIERGHSALGPVSVVRTRTRHRDGHLYEQKFIVQHRLDGAVPSCVVYASHGDAYRLE
jgi:hypothetical protein